MRDAQLNGVDAGVPRARAELVGARGYRSQVLPAHVDVRLDANEGRAAPDQLLAEAAAVAAARGVHRYPDASRLEALLADRLEIAADRVVVTAGGDDAIDRVCRSFLAPGRELILPSPTFEMIARGGRLAGASVVEIEWADGAFPTDEVVSAVNERTGVIAVVSPNNPTGCVAGAGDLRRISRAASRVGALVMLDAAYAEFAGEAFDLTRSGLGLPNVVVIRTFSKAYGLAGLRVGYAAGPAEVIETLRAAGGPYPCSVFSLAAVELALMDDRRYAVGADIEVIVQEREELTRFLHEFNDRGPGWRRTPRAAPLSIRAQESRANFILVRFGEAGLRDRVWSVLMEVGVATRRFTTNARLSDALRITCPGDREGMSALRAGLRAALAPEAIIFDMDGVLADVSRSYRASIIETARSYGVELTSRDIDHAKALGNANNDWDLTHRLITERGGRALPHEVKQRFEVIYQGAGGTPGLCETETLIPPVDLLRRLSRRVKLGIVTGRPRADAERFLKKFDLGGLFCCEVCMEDAPLKPDPAPVRRALGAMLANGAWMVGDTVDDIRAARAARVLPIGIPPPGERREECRAVLRGECGFVIDSLEELEEMLP